MLDSEFCRIESSFSGEKIDKVEQLVSVNFTGRELKEYLEHAINMLESDKKNMKAEKIADNFITNLQNAGISLEQVMKILDIARDKFITYEIIDNPVKCNYKLSGRELPYPRVEWISECGFILARMEGYNSSGEPVKPTGKCMKCGKEINAKTENDVKTDVVVESFGVVKTVGELKSLLKEFDDNVNVGFRNQEAQELIKIETDKDTFLAFQQIK